MGKGQKGARTRAKSAAARSTSFASTARRCTSASTPASTFAHVASPEPKGDGVNHPGSRGARERKGLRTLQALGGLWRVGHPRLQLQVLQLAPQPQHRAGRHIPPDRAVQSAEGRHRQQGLAVHHRGVQTGAEDVATEPTAGAKRGHSPHPHELHAPLRGGHVLPAPCLLLRAAAGSREADAVRVCAAPRCVAETLAEPLP